MKVPFSKYEGAGNDFIVIDMISSQYNLTAAQLEAMCQRKTGVGSDGIVVLKESLLPGCHFKFAYYNKTKGVEARLCGNGSRCILQFAEQVGLIKIEEGGPPILFEACDGVHTGGKVSPGKYFVSIKDVPLKNCIQIDDRNYSLDLGSPHYVRFVEDLDKTDVIKIGQELRRTTDSNVNFVQVTQNGNANTIALRTYERGVEEETLACGTGSTASAIVTFLRQHYFKNPDGRKGSAESSVTTRVSMRGGELEVQFTVGEQAVTDIRLSGPVTHVFDGVLYL